MKWGNLNWEDGLYYIRETQSRSHGFTTAKTESSEAEVPVPRVLPEALGDHRKHQLEAKLMNGSRWQEMDLIFPAPTRGTPVQHSQLSGKWHPAICKAAGLRARRTAAARWAISGAFPAHRCRTERCTFRNLNNCRIRPWSSQH